MPLLVAFLELSAERAMSGMGCTLPMKMNRQQKKGVARGAFCKFLNAMGIDVGKLGHLTQIGWDQMRERSRMPGVPPPRMFLKRYDLKRLVGGGLQTI